VFVPPVNIQAPVVLAAFSSPLRISCESNRNQFRFQDATAIQLACDTRPFLAFWDGFLAKVLPTFFSLACKSKLALPPCTVIKSFGNSRFHSLVNSCTSNSGRVSNDRRTYWKKRSKVIKDRTKRDCPEMGVQFYEPGPLWDGRRPGTRWFHRRPWAAGGCASWAARGLRATHSRCPE